MKITWFGRACFELVTANGAVIICDPYHPLTGYEAHPRKADIVTISHEHGDHNFTGWIKGAPEILRGALDRTVKGVRVVGLAAYHDNSGGAQRGPNTIFVFEADGLRVCHLGDLGHEPDDALYAQIGRPDVLFVPAGGFFTLEPARAAAVAARVGAKLTIPMHYKTGTKDEPIETVDAFAGRMKAERRDECEITVDVDYTGPRCVVLDYLR
jgi:L-ascorbate metabolism protein UlaG (beta-lactamase superfamily)